ncbi:hypothetical protein [Thermus scotoductus]|uniref:Minor coat protein n=1 Tax=Thermus scotoductus TaxID=37636 RepID=A0A430URB1_THESC|nr:hypothetical protein [Thermus scotoductus]RTI10715.1 hypothetical protein CSW27_13815 [Thermus scotoductus]
MGAIISGLLDLLQWLAGTFSVVAHWLVATVQAVAQWVLGLAGWVISTAWNLLVQVLLWLVNGVFWLLGHLVEAGLSVLVVLARLLPPIPPDLTIVHDVIIPAFNVANQILPITDALAAGSLWMIFYALMAAWRVITFIRGGR